MHTLIYYRKSLTYWIHTLIITTYCMNKSGFHCALSICPFSSFTRSILLLLLLPISQAPYSFFRFFFLYPGRSRIFRTTLAYQSLFYTTTLRGSVENYPSTNHFYFTWLVQMLKNLHYNLLIHLLNALAFHAARKHASLVFILGSLVNKRGMI